MWERRHAFPAPTTKRHPDLAIVGTNKLSHPPQMQDEVGAETAIRVLLLTTALPYSKGAVRSTRTCPGAAGRGFYLL